MMYLGKDAVGIAVETGAEFIKGSFTCGENESTKQINFGKAFDKYLFYIEATDISKTAIINSGEDSSKTFAFIGIYPSIEIDNQTTLLNTLVYRIKPSTEVIAYALITLSASNTYISNEVTDISDSTNAFFKGITYNYYIVEIK